MSDKLVKASAEVAPASSFVDAIERAHSEQLARPALERCPACGSASMRDPQAQFVGACSPTCAKALGISDEVLRASARVPPAQLSVVDLLAPETPPMCRKCGGCGSVSVPSELADTQCSACWGTGVDDSTSDSAIEPVVVRPPPTLQIRECGATSPPLTINGARAVCSRLIDHEGSHGGKEPTFDGFVTWQSREAW